jgi:hypothetical protein
MASPIEIQTLLNEQNKTKAREPHSVANVVIDVENHVPRHKSTVLTS